MKQGQSEPLQVSQRQSLQHSRVVLGLLQQRQSLQTGRSMLSSEQIPLLSIPPAVSGISLTASLHVGCAIPPGWYSHLSTP